MRVRFLVGEDPLEEGMATRSSILTWRIRWTEEPGGLQSTGSQTVGHNEATKHAHTSQDRLYNYSQNNKSNCFPTKGSTVLYVFKIQRDKLILVINCLI